jgi:hypothetical protein
LLIPNSTEHPIGRLFDFEFGLMALEMRSKDAGSVGSYIMINTEIKQKYQRAHQITERTGVQACQGRTMTPTAVIHQG